VRHVPHPKTTIKKHLLRRVRRKIQVQKNINFQQG
jgi:hypothetical protein